MNSPLAAGLLACALFTGACRPGQGPAPDTRDATLQAIRDTEDAWNKDFEARDAAKLLAHYSDDAVLMGAGFPAAHGKPAIGKLLQDMVADPVLAMKFHATRIEVAQSGDLAYTQGAYRMTLTNPDTKQPMNDKGSYMTVYKKQADGSWKAVSDISASELPPSN